MREEGDGIFIHVYRTLAMSGLGVVIGIAAEAADRLKIPFLLALP